MKREKGLTLIELVVTIAVVGILAVVAIPNLTSTLSNGRLTSRANELLSALSFARTEAIKRGIPITVCRSANASGASESGWTCSTGSGGGWEDGWFVFADTNGDGAAQSGEARLRGKGGMARAVYTMRGNNNVVNRITFSDQGMAMASIGTITVCDTERGRSRQIIVAPTGRVRIPDGAGTCS